MPDCLHKYKVILEKFKANGGEKFIDGQFKANKESIGDQVIEYNCDGEDLKWVRLSEHQTDEGQTHVLFDEEATANDVIQGALGDCYFLSSMAVLGNEEVKKRFYYINTDDEWLDSGCFCVVFFDNGKEEFVIVDD